MLRKEIKDAEWREKTQATQATQAKKLVILCFPAATISARKNRARIFESKPLTLIDVIRSKKCLLSLKRNHEAFYDD